MRITASLGLGFALLAFGLAAHGAANQRTYALGSYYVTVDNAPGVWVPKISGGGATAEVVLERPGQQGAYPKKHAGTVKYEDIAFGINGPMEKGMHDWVKQSLATAQPVMKNGAFYALDFNFKELSRTSWTSGFISDFSFPELDGASKDAAYVYVTVTPQMTKTQTGSGASQPAQIQKSKSNVMLASNFRMTIPGLPTSRVAHIEPMSVRFTQTAAPIGEMREYERTPGKVDVSNLVFTVSEADAAPFFAWHDDFVVKGNNSDKFEKTGSIELLAGDMKTVHYKLNMSGIGIIKYTPDRSSTETIRRVRIECYVESVSLD